MSLSDMTEAAFTANDRLIILNPQGLNLLWVRVAYMERVGLGFGRAIK